MNTATTALQALFLVIWIKQNLFLLYFHIYIRNIFRAEERSVIHEPKIRKLSCNLNPISLIFNFALMQRLKWLKSME